MTATADMILERRRARRRLAFWRVIAIIAVLAAVLAVVPLQRAGTGAAHVARIDIDGVITTDRDRAETIARIAKSDAARALVVHISSPGGTVVGSEALYEALREVAEVKPVVAVVGELAASGGYVAAIGADHIVTRHNSITGSIGVVSQVPDITGLLDRLGIDVTEVKSSPLKAAPSPVSEDPPEAVAALEDLILDSYAWFRGLVAERRGLEGEGLERVADGRVFIGAQAMELGLVDAIGDEATARDWLAETREVSADLPMRQYRWGRRDLPFPLDQVDAAFGGVLERFLTSGSALPLAGTGPRLLALYTG